MHAAHSGPCSARRAGAAQEGVVAHGGGQAAAGGARPEPLAARGHCQGHHAHVHALAGAAPALLASSQLGPRAGRPQGAGSSRAAVAPGHGKLRGVLGAPGGSTILPHKRARACPSRRGVGPGACGAAARVRVPAAGATDRAAEAHCMRVGPRLRRRAAGWAAPTRACARAGPAGHRKDEDAARAAARAGNRGRRAPRRARGPHPGLRRHQCRHGQPGGGPAAARRARHPPRPALQGAGDSLEFECLQSDLVYPPVSLPSKQRGRAAGLSAACSATATCAQRVTCSVFPLRLVHLTHDVICGQAASFHSGAHWSSEELACQTAGDAGWARHAAWLGLHKAAQLCTGSRLLLGDGGRMQSCHGARRSARACARPRHWSFRATTRCQGKWCARGLHTC